MKPALGYKKYSKKEKKKKTNYGADCQLLTSELNLKAFFVVPCFVTYVATKHFRLFFATFV